MRTMTRRTNAFPAACNRCGARIEARQGLLRREGGAWIVEHESCDAQDNEGEAERLAVLADAKREAALAARGVSVAVPSDDSVEGDRLAEEYEAHEARLAAIEAEYEERMADQLADEYATERVRRIDAEFGLTPGARDIA